jgi:hypothetical protein
MTEEHAEAILMSFNRKNAYTNVLECQLVVLKKTINNNAFCTQHLLTKHAHLIVIFQTLYCDFQFLPAKFY